MAVCESFWNILFFKFYVARTQEKPVFFQIAVPPEYSTANPDWTSLINSKNKGKFP